MDLELNPELMLTVRWTSRGSCGVPGCAEPDCVCALCAKPIGIPENDPRRDSHYEDCYGCEICEDDVPMMLFCGQGKDCAQAAFHNACFKRLLGETK